mmetsp:Transcript_2557/g.3907  ORF Transcript_2557/g.3907 Transcript_2557/m.3907 type:complete len:219 (-) Transcript_2557:1243-1899(-)
MRLSCASKRFKTLFSGNSEGKLPFKLFPLTSNKINRGNSVGSSKEDGKLPLTKLSLTSRMIKLLRESKDPSLRYPVKLLSSRKRVFILINDFRFWKSPAMRLSSTANRSSLIKPDMDSGKVPVMKLLESSNISRLPKDPIESGIEPVRSLYIKDSFRNLTNPVTLEGIGPLIELWLILNSTIFLSKLISFGRVPTRLLLFGKCKTPTSKSSLQNIPAW